jgi:hypothetical protein
MAEEKENVEIYTVQEESSTILPDISQWKINKQRSYVCKVGSGYSCHKKIWQARVLNFLDTMLLILLCHNILNSIWVCLLHFIYFAFKSP